MNDIGDQFKRLCEQNPQPQQSLHSSEPLEKRLPKRGLDRFTKIGRQGEYLAADATEWVALLDKKEQRIWEIKTGRGLQRREYRFTNYEENEKPVDDSNVSSGDLLSRINAERLAGAQDWRMPTLKELEDLWKAIDETGEWGIPKEAVWYWSSTPSPDKEFDTKQAEKQVVCLLSFRGGYRSSDFRKEQYAVRAIRQLAEPQ